MSNATDAYRYGEGFHMIISYYMCIKISNREGWISRWLCLIIISIGNVIVLVQKVIWIDWIGALGSISSSTLLILNSTVNLYYEQLISTYMHTALL